MSTCVDASLIIKALTPEEGSEQAQDLLLRLAQEQDRLIAPSFFLYEIHSVLRKKNQIGNLDDESVLRCLKQIEEYGIEILPDQHLIPIAMSTSKKLRIPFIYDSLYLALAQQENATFWTCDKKFHDLAKPHFDNVRCV